MDERPLIRALEASCAQWEEKEGKDAWRRAVTGIISGTEQTTRSAASRCCWEIRRATRGRQDSTARIPVGVAEKQFVVHLWTLCQNVFRHAMAPALGERRSAPYSRMGATKDVASLWHRYGDRPAPGGLRRLIRGKAPWARASRFEKWEEESRAGVNQYPSDLSESRGRNGSPFISMGERHFGEFLWLGVVQCMSCVLVTEKETPMWRALASSFSKSSWRRWMLTLYEGEVAVRAKSSTYEIIRPRGTLKWKGET